MANIFVDKNLLDQEYKKLFLDRLFSTSRLQECINSRYDKKAITSETIRAILSNNHKAIFDFIGTENENRIRFFFGTNQKKDKRDNQIRLIDRFILDCIHFDVISSLMMQFSNEYSKNQNEIDKAWQAEINLARSLGPIPNDVIIQQAIKLNKHRVFKDLVFPDIGHVELFIFNKNTLEPDKKIFANWPLNANTNNSRRSLILFGLAAALSALGLGAFIVGNSLLGGIIGVTASIFIGITLATVLAVSVCGFLYNTMSPKSHNQLSIEQNDDDDKFSISYMLMRMKMPFAKVIPPMQQEPEQPSRIIPAPDQATINQKITEPQHHSIPRF